MKRLSTKTGLYPHAFDLRNVAGLDSAIIADGGFADVRKGTYNQQEVCIKTIRTYQNREKIQKLALISAWASNGTITDFLKENPRANRLLLVRVVYKTRCARLSKSPSVLTRPEAFSTYTNTTSYMVTSKE
ncbi:hypothetical protein H0H81_010268 [Sphagnurus paluster]|uniref:Uncharacterized protein n=1 Tax=Sphagnurus paluster TaxID=117069 RepID=A0A9P7K4A8_9AGAR|nr:hypothetical protein H0H81_010268 [Sphagnurus paluster]